MELLWLWLLPLLLGVVVLLLASYFRALWQHRRFLAEAATALLLASLLFAVLLPVSSLVLLGLVVLQLWLVLVAMRLIAGRLEPEFLQHSTTANVCLLAGAMALLTFGGSAFAAVPPLALHVAVVVGCLVVALFFIRQVLWARKHYTLGSAGGRIEFNALPTVSVCIPARNENHALSECLAAVLRSDYPKLEVLVLDDCSQDTTSDVIKAFAHDGVRFIQGKTPASGWLGRNQALSTLAQQATGQYLLFMSVDTLLERHSLHALVAAAQHKDMLSVLPFARPGTVLATVAAPMQAFWQIALPITRRRVPISSKCWLIKARVLKDQLGGFGSVRHKIVPEGSFARRLHTAGTYHFAVCDAQLGITTAKSWPDQAHTAMRILYPTFKRQPVYVLGGVLALGTLLSPFALVLVLAVAGSFGAVFWLAAVAAMLLMVAYGLVASRLHPSNWVLTTLVLPFVLLQEAFLLVASMLAYEFAEVTWKGRNVCYPVLTRGRRS